MIELPRILIQEEEDVAEGCNSKHSNREIDVLVSIHNNAGKFKQANTC